MTYLVSRKTSSLNYIKFVTLLQIMLQGLAPLVFAIKPSTSISAPLSEIVTNYNSIVPANSTSSTQAGNWDKYDNHPATQVTPSETSNGDQQIAQWLSQVGQAAQNGNVKSTAKNLAVGSASSSIQHWINQVGHARVQMNVNDKMHLDGSNADLLLPLSDIGDLLTFTQFGIHDKEGYTTANFGLGLRWFLGEQMLGYNGFIDQELRNKHTRMGVGVEYWRDYIKLAVNGYRSGLTGWKESKQLQDYEEKSASGFDLRSEGYLPTYPRLGAKLSYEQYFGDEVGLFGKELRQRNPYAVTTGLTYTPIPLVTAGVEHKQGKSCVNDTQFSLQFNYLLGVPWGQQTSGYYVDTLRTMNGSRMEFVDRNNNMVMQYRKMEVITLTLPVTLDGEAGTHQSILAKITGRHGLSHIQWNDSELVAAGGGIKAVNNVQYQIMLPLQKGNFTLSAVAYDNNGNASNPASTIITVTEAGSSPIITIGKLTYDKGQAVADSNDTVTYTLTATQGSRNTAASFSGYKVKWAKASGNSVGDFSSEEAELDDKGQAQLTVTSSTLGMVELVATLLDASGQQTDQHENNDVEFVEFIAAKPTVNKIELSAVDNEQWVDTNVKLDAKITLDSTTSTPVVIDLKWVDDGCSDCSYSASPSVSISADSNNGSLTGGTVKPNSTSAATSDRTMKLCTTDETLCSNSVTVKFYALPSIIGYQPKGGSTVIGSTIYNEVRVKHGIINVNSQVDSALVKTWSSSNALAVSVDSNGQITLKADGAATINLKVIKGNLTEKIVSFTVSTSAAWYEVSDTRGTIVAMGKCTNGNPVGVIRDIVHLVGVWGSLTTYPGINFGSWNPVAWVAGTHNGNVGTIVYLDSSSPSGHTTGDVNEVADIGLYFSICK